MTQEEKDLVLRDLCARLPYKVIVEIKSYGQETQKPWFGELSCKDLDCFLHDVAYKSIKPYLRPMSSITEEEQKILEDFGITISPFSGQLHVPFDEINFPYITMQKFISYLYSIHIDINGLIEKGLAIEVTEENNPYKIDK